MNIYLRTLSIKCSPYRLYQKIRLVIYYSKLITSKLIISDNPSPSTELLDTTNCNIMAEGFRFMPLGLVRLRTFRLNAWVT